MCIAALVAQQNVKCQQKSALLDLTHCYTMVVLHYWQSKKKQLKGHQNSLCMLLLL